MITWIVQDEKGKCWKFAMTEDMTLDEIWKGVKAQFYEGIKTRKLERGGK